MDKTMEIEPEQLYGYYRIDAENASAFAPARKGDQFAIKKECCGTVKWNETKFDGTDFEISCFPYRRRIDIDVGYAPGTWRLVGWYEKVAFGDESLMDNGTWKRITMPLDHTPSSLVPRSQAVRRRVKPQDVPVPKPEPSATETHRCRNCGGELRCERCEKDYAACELMYKKEFEEQCLVGSKESEIIFKMAWNLALQYAREDTRKERVQ